MPDSHSASLDEHANDIEAVGVRGPAMSIDPNPRGAAQLPLLPPSDCLDRTAEPRTAARLDLDERHITVSLDHEIDVLVPAPEAALYHPPPPAPKPPLRDPLP